MQSQTTFILLSSRQTWLTVKNAFSPNFHTEWSNSCLQDLANQTLLPLALPNYTANNFHCDWARWANQATQAQQLFTSSCPTWLRRTGTAFFRVSQVWEEEEAKQSLSEGVPPSAPLAPRLIYVQVRGSADIFLRLFCVLNLKMGLFALSIIIQWI